MAHVIPPPGTKGLFLLRSPFATVEGLVYHVSAQRSFEDLIRRGIDPIELVYKPVGLGEAEYTADSESGAYVITLLTPSDKAIFVPDTYIDSYPDMGVIPHSWVVVSASCGMLPDTYPTEALEQAMKEVISDHTGVEANVFISRAPVTQAITQEQYVQNVAARNAAIKTRVSTYAENIALKKRNDDLEASELELLSLIEALQAEIEELKGTPP